jgi:GNAT superfamily N-acetyltransferase
VNKIVIKPMQQKHVKDVAKLYSIDLWEAILSYFGDDFLRKMLQSTLTHNWGFVAEDENENKILGFIVSFKSEISLLRCLSGKSVITVLLNCICNPLLVFAIIKSFLVSYVGRHKFLEGDGVCIELAHFAVSSGSQGNGVGASLIEALEGRAKLEGYTSVYTSTHNKRLRNYYTRTRNATVISSYNVGIYTTHNIRWNLSVAN